MRLAIVVIVGVSLATALAGSARADSFDNQMSLQRNQLRTEYRKVGKELAALEREIEDQDGESTITGSASAVWAVQTSMHDRTRKLQAQRNELRQRQTAIQREFRQLTRQIEERYDEIPIWWGGLD